MAKLKVGVVGAGRIAARHLEVLQSLPGVTLAGICSRTRAKAETLAREHGIATVTDDMDALIAETRPDALLLLVSVAEMHRTVLQALEYGLPLFIEKPAGLDPRQTGELAEHAHAKGVPSMVGYNRRFYSVFRQGMDRLRQSGRLLGLAVEGHERIQLVRATGIHPDEVLRAWLYANGTHTVDLLRFFGGEVRQVRSFARRVQEPLVDSMAAALEFEDGTLGQYGAHWLSAAGWRVSLYGEGIAVEFAPLEAGRWIDASGAQGTFEANPEDRRFKPGFHGQMVAFCALARGAALAPAAIDLAGAHRTMLLAEALAQGAAGREGA